MDGAVAAGELDTEAAQGRGAHGVRIALATAADDGGIRELLRNTPMRGAIELSLEREPNAFAADAIEGDFHQTMVAKDDAGRIVAMGGRSVRDAYINGEARRLGYLGQLRIAEGYRGRDLLVRGYAFLRELHEDGWARFYLTSIMAENLGARRLLEAGLRGMPTYRTVGELVTYVVPTRAGRGREGVVRARREDLGEMVEWMGRCHRRGQFMPVWSIGEIGGSGGELAGGEDFKGRQECPPHQLGLELDDFLVVRRGGEIAGCAAVWDQRAVKQVVVRRYSRQLARWRWVVNGAARLAGWPALPAVGRAISQAYLSHLAVEEGDEERFGMLLDAALVLASEKECDYLLVGLAAKSALARYLARRWKHRAVRSVLYVVYWEDGREAVERLDGREVRVEVATL